MSRGSRASRGLSRRCCRRLCCVGAPGAFWLCPPRLTAPVDRRSGSHTGSRGASLAPDSSRPGPLVHSADTPVTHRRPRQFRCPTPPRRPRSPAPPSQCWWLVTIPQTCGTFMSPQDVRNHGFKTLVGFGSHVSGVPAPGAFHSCPLWLPCNLSPGRYLYLLKGRKIGAESVSPSDHHPTLLGDLQLPGRVGIDPHGLPRRQLHRLALDSQRCRPVE